MLSNESLEFRDDRGIPSERNIRVQPLLQNRESQLLQAAYLHLGGRFEREIGQRRSSPERERLLQQRGRRPGIAPVGSRTPVGDEPLELLEVELPRLEPHHVAGRTRYEDLARPLAISRGERLPQL